MITSYATEKIQKNTSKVKSLFSVKLHAAYLYLPVYLS